MIAGAALVTNWWLGSEGENVTRFGLIIGGFLALFVVSLALYLLLRSENKRMLCRLGLYWSLSS